MTRQPKSGRSQHQSLSHRQPTSKTSGKALQSWLLNDLNHRNHQSCTAAEDLIATTSQIPWKIPGTGKIPS